LTLYADDAFLKDYTGWFKSTSGERIVVTLEYEQLRIGNIAEGPGAILISTDITLSTSRNQDTRVSAKTHPGGNRILFNIVDGKIESVTMNKKTYQRTDPGACHIVRLPAEVRERIWKEVLRRNHPKGEVALTSYEGVPMISGNIKVCVTQFRLCQTY